MFTKPIDEITFEDVESFCKEWGEGVRVEYKREVAEIKGKIPIIVSSFANFYGGIFFIGVKADKTKNEVIFPIQGIPDTPGIEEQIQQSALTGIYPGVIPEIKVVDVPNTGNVVVIVRVDESVQAPHAIENSTKVYVRTGSITQPYELSDMDRLVYMFKRREDSQVVAQQILNRIKGRVGYRIRPSPEKPGLTIVVQPVFSYRPVISTSNVYELADKKSSSLRRVEGGVSYVERRYSGGKYSDGSTNDYIELNEYGIIYRRTVLSIYENDHNQERMDCGQLFFLIKDLIKWAVDLYKKCEYLGNIKISIQLQEILDRILSDLSGRSYREEITGSLINNPACFDTEVSSSIECLAHDLENEDKRNAIVEELMCQLLWAFNIPVDNPRVKEKVRKRIEREFS